MLTTEYAVVAWQRVFRLYLLTWLAVSLAVGARAEMPEAWKLVNNHQGTQQTVTGKVTSAADGAPLVGVTVTVKGTALATQSDSTGKYSISVPGPNATLVFSYVGFIAAEIPVNNQTAIDIVLQPEGTNLEETVVIGYGKQRVRDLTAAVSVVSAKDLENRPITNASQALQAVKGVYVNQPGGQPGADGATIRIRGIGSIGSAGKLNPLVLVDGVEFPIGDVNPTDIESISVLKDAASASIYGSRGANGVVLITTKKGSVRRAVVNYSGYYGFQEAIYLPDPVDNSADFMEWYNKAQVNQGSPPVYPDSLIRQFRDNPTSLEYPNTNWMKVMFDRAPVQEHSIRFAGGNERTQYNTSVRYLDQDGVLMGTSYKMYSANLNLQTKISEKLSLDAQILLSSRQLKDQAGGSDAAMNRIMRLVPMQPEGRMADGSWPDSWVPTPGQNGFENPLIRAQETYSRLENNRVLASLSLKYNILKNLNYQVRASINQRYALTKSWNPLIYLTNVRTGQPTRPWSGAISTRSNSQTEDQDWTVFHTFNYTTQISDNHKLNALLGASIERFRDEAFSAAIDGFQTLDLNELDLGTINPRVSGNSGLDVLMSYFGRVQYSFKERYLLEASGRYDGSSRIAREHRWGLFPSVSTGWILSEENFLKNEPWLTELKIRASWGQIGNQEIGRFQFVPAVATGYNYPFGGVISPGAAVIQTRDPALKWETTTMTNLGLDWILLKGSLTGSFEVFRKRTSGILRQVNIPAQVGDLAGPVTNVAVVDNNGMEAALNYRNRIGKDFTYEIGGHITKIKNEVVDLRGERIIANNRITEEGQPIESWYVFKTDGLFQTKEEVAAYPTISKRVGPGDVKYVDLNNDGKIDGDDRYIAGSTFPDLTYGFNIGLGFKGLQLSTIWNGVMGVDVYPDHNMAMPFNNGAGLTKRWLTDSWTPERPNAPLPRISARNQFAAENFSISDFWLRDASYLRMKNIQLSYILPGGLLDRIGVSQVQVFANAQNLLTISKMKEWDPETDILLNTSTSTNSTYSHYPSVKTYTMGVNINF